jgi:hypothetical protein
MSDIRRCTWRVHARARTRLAEVRQLVALINEQVDQPFRRLAAQRRRDVLRHHAGRRLDLGPAMRSGADDAPFHELVSRPFNAWSGPQIRPESMDAALFETAG